MAYGILVPRPGIEPMPPALEEWSLNHWTNKGVSICPSALKKKDLLLLKYVCARLLSCVRLFVTPWTVAHQSPLSMGFPRQEY